MTIYNIEITKEQAEEMDDVIGFSDGKDVYLNTIRTGYFGALQGKKFSHKTNFVKVDLIGKFLYFKDLMHNNKMHNGSPIGLSTGVGGGFGIGFNVGASRVYLPHVIDTKTGEKIKLSVKEMKKMLEDDPELLKEFISDKQRKKKFENYVDKYNNRYRIKQNLQLRI